MTTRVSTLCVLKYTSLCFPFAGLQRLFGCRETNRTDQLHDFEKLAEGKAVLCRKWLSDNADAIQSGAAILTVLIGAIGFYVMWDQLSQTKVQISQTNKVFQASNTYQIQKDAREIVDKVKGNSNFREAIKSGISKDNKKNFLDDLWIMLNFYLSVYRQAQMEGVTQDFIASFKKDFCGFLKLHAVVEGWKELHDAGRLSSSHDEMRSKWCEAT